MERDKVQCFHRVRGNDTTLARWTLRLCERLPNGRLISDLFRLVCKLIEYRLNQRVNITFVTKNNPTNSRGGP